MRKGSLLAIYALCELSLCVWFDCLYVFFIYVVFVPKIRQVEK